MQNESKVVLGNSLPSKYKHILPFTRENIKINFLSALRGQ